MMNKVWRHFSRHDGSQILRLFDTFSWEQMQFSFLLPFSIELNSLFYGLCHPAKENGSHGKSSPFQMWQKVFEVGGHSISPAND